MRLSQQIAIPGIITVICLIVLAGFTLITYENYNRILIEASRSLEDISNLTAQLNDLHNQRVEYVLSYRFLPQASFLYSLDELELRTNEITAELQRDFKDSRRGQFLLNSFIQSRQVMRQTQDRLVTAIRGGDRENIDLLFAEWSLRERFNQAHLKDIVGFSNINQAAAVMMVRRFTARTVIIFSVILALSFITTLISQTYFRSHVVIPLTRLASGLKHVGEGEFDHRVSVNSADEIGDLATSFNSMVSRLGVITAQLKESNRRLESFTSVAAHDLRSPICTIRDFSQMLQEDSGDKLSKEDQDVLDRISRISDRSIHLIDSLLTYSRSAQKPLKAEATDLNFVVQDVLSSLQSQIATTGGRLDIQKLPSVVGDAIQLGELFQNLIGNALKYHKLDVAPQVKIWSEESEDGSSHQIYVRDNGIGFNPRENEAIFTAFHRAREASGYEGSGVGLAICKEIVERHNGHIKADSVPGIGSTFTITLPKSLPS